jgi:hypothetical protein
MNQSKCVYILLLFKYKKDMKKFLLATVCLFIVTLAVSAQRPNQGTPEENAKRNTERMKTELNLTPEQVAPVDSINLVFAKAQAKLIEKANGDFASVREDMQKLNALRSEAYEKVLTKEQLASYKKIQEARRARMGQGGQGGGQRPRNN